jgi:hypothetical protein
MSIAVCLFLFTAACQSDRAPSSSSPTGAMRHRLWQVAQRAAHGGKVNALGAQAVLTTDTQAVRLLHGPGAGEGDVTGRHVWLLAIHGDRQFDCECGVEPAPDGHADGRFLLMLIDRSSLDDIGLGGGLFTESPALRQLGNVINLGPGS